MRPQPDYLPYRQAHPPRARRWLTAGAVVAFVSGAGMALLPAVDRGGALMAWVIACGVALTGVGWLLRQLHYRISVHHAQYYAQLVEQEGQDWWARHQQTFGLRETVLLGPVGSEAKHWEQLLKREHPIPEEKTEAGGRTLRLVHSFVSDPDAREQQLAGMLVRQWLAQRGDAALPRLSHCYWLGSELAWRTFCELLAESYPALQLPAVPEKWQGEASLSAITARINDPHEERLILVAGCQSLTAMSASARPAGESAVLWLVSREGSARITRGERYNVGQGESILGVCARAMQQSKVTSPPDPCMVFTQPHVPELVQSGWNIMQFLQDVNWGDTGQMEPLIVITLAALYTSQCDQPCGWIARDPQHSLALGIVTPTDNSPSSNTLT